MNQEYKIPTEYNKAPQEAGAVTLGEISSRKHEMISPLSERVYSIVNSITNARENYANQHFQNNKKSLFHGVLKGLAKNKDEFSAPRNENDLKNLEGEIGSRLFRESTKPNETINFFFDQDKSWFFHRESINGQSKSSLTLHYEVRNEGILRVNNDNGISSEYIKGQELERFVSATEMYQQLVFQEIYNNPNLINN